MRYLLSKAYQVVGFVLGIFLMGLMISPVMAEDPVGRISIGVNFGIAGLAMDDVNREIDRGNDYLRFKGLTTMDRLSSGYNVYGDFKTALKDPFYISLGYGTLTALSEVSYNQILSAKADATVIFGRLLYAIPWRPFENGRLFVGGGGVLLRDAVLEIGHERDEEAKVPERKEIISFKGSGSGFQFDILGEYLIGDHMTFMMNAGYRFATADYDDWSIAIRHADHQAYRGIDAFADDEQLFWAYRDIDAFLLHSFLQDPGNRPDPDDEEAANADGPPINTLKVVDNLNLDFSGARFEVGLRFYFF
ncbi:MAG: hypothetical protein KJ970_19790 [Candidatus Eisenbacteria bacterium]|uniref:Uncharacterized protein n=1 Tax=Eiseniibacteriota bacterium TaxID=2212470 RepID=A0A948S0X3_UNCEI|nr:hypothetical protein [Candidatus Eisenbacteria bacterium]MBU1951034.1 hypothetical protein [Candidatus Eisenbacteria bacterium]MBU2693164.1 hypothetical protein [Candidatus Eisenbacteria bacterium]